MKDYGMVAQGYLLLAYSQGIPSAVVSIAKAIREEKVEAESLFEALRQATRYCRFRMVSVESLLDAVDSALAIENLIDLPPEVLGSMADTFYS